MMLEWIRLLGKFPTVYIQALSGGPARWLSPRAAGTSPGRAGRPDAPLHSFPVQPLRPHGRGLGGSEEKKYPEGWEKNIPDLPQSPDRHRHPGRGLSQDLSRPGPARAGKRRRSSPSTRTPLRSSPAWWRSGNSVRIGPAAAIGLGGFFEALKRGLLRNGDRVLINIGEGIRRAPGS